MVIFCYHLSIDVIFQISTLTLGDIHIYIYIVYIYIYLENIERKTSFFKAKCMDRNGVRFLFLGILLYEQKKNVSIL